MARRQLRDNKEDFRTRLRLGDPVMVIAGGNENGGRVLKGKIGKLRKVMKKKDRVIVEGVNLVKRHKRATAVNEAAGIIEKEGSIHISNVMFYSEKLQKPVRLRSKILGDGRKVRGFTHPETKQFEQIDI